MRCSPPHELMIAGGAHRLWRSRGCEASVLAMLKSLLAACLLLLVAVPAQAAIGDWSQGDHVRLRLVASRAVDGKIDGVVQLELDPGWKTYWRSPGDAGIPPRLDFGGSVNASGVQVDFPAPERSDDGFAATNVYHDRVALPFRVAESAVGQPVRLELAADLGVCEAICVPVSLTASLDIPAAESDGDAAELVAEARAAIPGPGRPGRFEILSLRRAGGSDKLPVFEAAVQVPPGDALLFVETPSDWYAAPPESSGATGSGATLFRFEVDRKSATSALDGAEIRLTLRGGDASAERTFRLDASGSAP